MSQKNEDEFFEAWKQYRALNPAVRQDAVEDVDSETERIRKALQGSDDDEDGPGPAGPPAAAAEAAAAAAAVDSQLIPWPAAGALKNTDRLIQAYTA